MIYPEVEQSIAIMEPGTLCVLMNGILCRWDHPSGGKR